MTESDALKAMRLREIDNAEDLLQHATPAAILVACDRFDRKKARGQNVGTGLLAKWIREGGFEEQPKQELASKQELMRQRFTMYAEAFPAGTATESHWSLSARCWPTDDCECGGEMVVFEACYPSLMAACEECGFLVGYPIRALGALRISKEAA